jgi:hypothetical protein
MEGLIYSIGKAVITPATNKSLILKKGLSLLMKRSVMMNPSSYKTETSGFFAPLGMTRTRRLFQKIVDIFDRWINNHEHD